jgi:hypothetical protein
MYEKIPRKVLDTPLHISELTLAWYPEHIQPRLRQNTVYEIVSALRVCEILYPLLPNNLQRCRGVSSL